MVISCGIVKAYYLYVDLTLVIKVLFQQKPAKLTDGFNTSKDSISGR
jgi:hypothetical protein